MCETQDDGLSLSALLRQRSLRCILQTLIFCVEQSSCWSSVLPVQKARRGWTWLDCAIVFLHTGSLRSVVPSAWSTTRAAEHRYP